MENFPKLPMYPIIVFGLGNVAEPATLDVRH